MLDDGAEPHALELRPLECDLARSRGEAAFVAAGADELVGLFVEYGDRLGRGVPPGMIEFGAQGMPTACVMSFLVCGCIWLSKERKVFYVAARFGGSRC